MVDAKGVDEQARDWGCVSISLMLLKDLSLCYGDQSSMASWPMTSHSDARFEELKHLAT